MPTKRKTHPATMRAINTVIDHLSHSYVRTPQARNTSIPKALATLTSTSKRFRHHTVQNLLTPNTSTSYLKQLFEKKYTFANSLLRRNNGNTDRATVQTLLSHGADPNIWTYDGLRWTTPLIQSIDTKKPQLTRLLLEAGADINATDTTGQTPLIHAILAKDTAMVRLLLESGADASVMDMHGKWAWDYANDVGSTPIAMLLLEKIAQ